MGQRSLYEIPEKLRQTGITLVDADNQSPEFTIQLAPERMRLLSEANLPHLDKREATKQGA